MKTSILDLFRLGIGPSSSHTVGPMRAARDFAMRLDHADALTRVAVLQVDFYGSLASTGRGHGTDRAVQLGLVGAEPETVDAKRVEAITAAVRSTRRIRILDRHPVKFEPAQHLAWHVGQRLPGHSNALRFKATDDAGTALGEEVYYSVGGGFIRREGDPPTSTCRLDDIPHPYSSARELLQRGANSNLQIWQLVLANEAARYGEAHVRRYVADIWNAMRSCMERGLRANGLLPGGLGVRRRALRIYARPGAASTPDPMECIDRVNAFAMAVSEENAAGGRVVTAPTNGAAGVIPAVARYYEDFIPGADSDGILRLLLTAGAIGVLYKENSSISGAEVGCQGEIGVACSMAAAGLVAALGGRNEQVEHAAEIGMEHHLGMTCDPIAGLVQIPCIERNAMGAVKAINACRMAMQDTGKHKVSLDQVIKTMLETGRDMQSRYKETSEGGLAVNVRDC